MPPDSTLALITYDPEILELAVNERRSSERGRYLSPDKLMNEDENYQMQCRIYEHLMDWGLDYDKVPASLR